VITKKGVTMRNKLEQYKRFIFIGIMIIALGVTFSTTLKESVGSIGIVFIAVGGLFFIIGMSKKRKEDERKNK
jgi:Sec-independent protein secretion pathway component TatC